MNPINAKTQVRAGSVVKTLLSAGLITQIDAAATQVAVDAVLARLTAAENVNTAQNTAQATETAARIAADTLLQSHIDAIYGGTLPGTMDSLKELLDFINTMQTAEGDIHTALLAQIAAKASQADVTALTGRVTAAEGQIAAKASQAALQAEINTRAFEIAALESAVTDLSILGEEHDDVLPSEVPNGVIATFTVPSSDYDSVRRVRVYLNGVKQVGAGITLGGGASPVITLVLPTAPEAGEVVSFDFKGRYLQG